MDDISTGKNIQKTIRVQLLGGFSVSVDGLAIPEAQWKSRRARNLVKLLALTPAHRLHRDQVIDTLAGIGFDGGGQQFPPDLLHRPACARTGRRERSIAGRRLPMPVCRRKTGSRGRRRAVRDSGSPGQELPGSGGISGCAGFLLWHPASRRYV